MELSDNNSNNGHVFLNINEYLSLLNIIENKQQSKPLQNYIISELKLSGKTNGKIDKYILFSTDIIIEQLQNKWNYIKLFPISIVISSIIIKYEDNQKQQNNAFINVNNNYHCIYIKDKGKYSLHLDIKVPYISTRGQGIEIHIPKSLKNLLDFTLFQHDIDINIVPSLGITLIKDNTNLTKPQNSYSSIKCNFPTTSKVSIQWKEKLDNEDECLLLSNTLNNEKQVIINIEEYILHTIGDGIIQSIFDLNYNILHGSRSFFEIFVPITSRILSIDGEAVKRWDIITDIDNNDINNYNIDKDYFKLLKIWLDYGIEDKYQLILHLESDMESKSCDIIVPSIRCFNINREKGYITITSNSNVEISELEQNGLARISFNELPKLLINRITNPPLLSYKFLCNPTLLQLDITKHKDVDILISTIECAHLQGTLSEDKILYHFTMFIRNTQSQYVRILLPNNSTVWSSLVSGRAVKPAKDSEGYVMIPLQKSTKSSNNTPFPVELVFLTILPNKIGKNGNLQLSICPLVDIPINHLFVTLKLPSNYKYSEFKGDLEEVLFFSSQPPNTSNYIDMNNTRGGVQTQIKQTNLKTNYIARKSKKKQKKALVSGILPVKIQMPSGGKAFRFERLLVIDESFNVSVNYKQIKRTLTRSTSHFHFLIIISFIIIIFILLLYLLY